MAFEHVFKPLTLRHKTLSNRIVFGAHTTNMSELGLPGDQHLGYYLARARGGAGMIVVEPMPVHPAAVLTRGNFRVNDEAVVPGFRRLTEACRAEGAVMIQQLYHVGAHGDGDNAWHAAWSPSGGPSWHDSDGSHTMSEAEIEATIDGFVQTARRCQDSGFDGVEVWAAYHGMLDQFWTPFSNTRDDQWGGSLENRTRFSREVLQRIRKACGEDFIVGLSVSDEPDVPVALSGEGLIDIVALHDREQLMDYVTVGSGGYFDFYKLMPTFLYGEKPTVGLTQALKSKLSHAKVIAEAHIRTPDNANTVLGAGEADLVSIVRGQIADPQLVNKARADQAERIRGCISCNQQCWGRRSRDYWISCLVNPAAGREHVWGQEPYLRGQAADRQRLLVVGGGPAGLEAARVAAERGLDVTLVEAGPSLGGQFRLAGMQPRRAQITDLIDWYERELTRLGVDQHFNAYWEAEEIQAWGEGQVVLATGSLPPETGFQKALPHLERLPGIERGGVMSAADVMARQAPIGKRVVVLDEGGFWKGCGTAWHLAEQGHEVSLVTPDPLVGKELQRSAADFPLRRTLVGLGVRLFTERAITAWIDEGAELVSLLDGTQETLAADTLVLATANYADMSLRDDLLALGLEPRLIGDANAPRNAAFAIFEGRKTALAL